MALSHVGYASAAAASVALPTFAAGDLAIVFAYRDGSNTAPSLPGGWTNHASAGGTSNSMRVGYRVLQASDSSTGVWTNATELQVLVLRGQHPTTPLGPNTAAGNGNSGTISYTGPLTLAATDGSSWIVALAGHRTATDVNSGTVSGMTNRSSGSATTSLGAHTEQVAAWASSKTQSVNTSAAWRSLVLEVVADSPAETGVAEISLGSGLTPSVRTGHSVVLRARTTGLAGTLRVQLYEGATARSAVLETAALTSSLTTYQLAIPQADATNIGSYGNLSLRIWGYSASGAAATFEVAEVELRLPAGTTGTSQGAVESPFTLAISTDSRVVTSGDKTTGTAELSLEPGLIPDVAPLAAVIDTFDRADTGPPPSGSWGNLALPGNTGLKVVSNQAAPNSTDAHSYWSAATFGPDCECYVTLATLTPGEYYRGLWLRVTDPTGTPSGYLLEFDRDPGFVDEVRIYRCDDGVFTQLGATVSMAYGTGDQIAFRAAGTRLTGLLKPAGADDWIEVIARTDSTHTGAGNVALYAGGLDDRLDNFGAGDLAVTQQLIVRARKTNGAHTGTVRAQLYEGTTPRSAELETGGLTTSFANYTLNISPAEAAQIVDYTNLSVRLRGYASTGDATVFEVASLYLAAPSSSLTDQTGAARIDSVATIIVGIEANLLSYPSDTLYPHALATVYTTATVTATIQTITAFGAVTTPIAWTSSTSGQQPNTPFGAAVLATVATIAAAGNTTDRLGAATIATVATLTVGGGSQEATGQATIATTATITVGGDFAEPPAPPGYTNLLPSLPDLLTAIAFDSQPLETIQLYEGVTEDTRQVDTRRGRQFELDRFEAGSGYLLLDNLDGKFNPENTASPYYPNLKPTRRLRISVAWNSVIYYLFTGFLEGFPQEYRYAGNDRIVSQNAVDLFMALAVARFIPASSSLQSTMAAITEDASELISADNVNLPMPQAVPFNITIGTETMSVTEIVVATSQYRVSRTATGSAAHAVGDPLTTDAVSFPQQYTGARIQAVLDYIGVAIASSLDAGQTLLAPSDNLAGQSPLEHIQLVVEAEQGRFFAAGNGTLTFHGRHHFYANEKTSRATFGDAGGTEIGYNNPRVTHDDAKLYNIIRITPASGATYEVRDEASIQDHFERPYEKQWPLADANEAKDAAEYLLARLSRMQIRVPEMDLLPQNRPTTTMPVALGLEIGQRYDFKLRPKDGSQMIDKTLVVEGVSHRLTPDTMQTQVQLSLADTTHYWQIEVAGYSELNDTTKLTY